MKPFNREKFLLYMLAGLLAWQAAIFTFGVVLCSRVTPQTNVTLVCPEIGGRFDKFVQTTLGCSPWLVSRCCCVNYESALSAFGRRPRRFGFTTSSTACTAFSTIDFGATFGKGASSTWLTVPSAAMCSSLPATRIVLSLLIKLGFAGLILSRE